MNLIIQQLKILNVYCLQKRRRPTQRRFLFLTILPSNTAKPVRGTLETLSWEVLPHVAYSPDLTPSDYRLLTSMDHALAEHR